MKAAAKTVGIVIPARNEAATIGPVAVAAVTAAQAMGGTVVVVADNCDDATAEIAFRAGAMVIERRENPSKAAAVVEGILAAPAEVTCLVDADCLGITPEAIVELVEPVRTGPATMSTLTFDYGPYSWLVESLPWSTGQRAFLTERFPLHDPRLDRYNLELLLNASVGAVGGLTVSRSLDGLHHRTKLAKSGLVVGLLANRAMWRSIACSARCVDKGDYRRYVENVVVDYDGCWKRPPLLVTRLGLAALVAAADLLSGGA